MARNIIIFGASRGIGAALAHLVPESGDHVWLVSRSRPPAVDVKDNVHREWIKTDLATDSAVRDVMAVVRDQPLDVVIYNAGIWESSAWSSSYQFTEIDPRENERIITVNLVAAIRCLQAIIPDLRRSPNGKIILIGSINGLPNASENYVAYAASKFGIRGVAHALREELRGDAIGVTCINPGSVATNISHEVSREAVLDRWGTELIPLQDIVAVVKCVIGLSRATVVKEIDMPAMDDKTL